MLNDHFVLFSVGFSTQLTSFPLLLSVLSLPFPFFLCVQRFHFIFFSAIVVALIQFIFSFWLFRSANRYKINENGQTDKKNEPNIIPVPPIKIMINEEHYEKTSSTKTYSTKRCGHVTKNSNKINESVKRLFQKVPNCIFTLHM